MKIVLITGAASGIGEATAQHFIDRGWRVCATARHPEKIGGWSRHERVLRLPLDVTDRVSVQSAVAECLRTTGRIDAVVNNAGVGMAGPLEALTVEGIEQHFRTNFFGPIHVMRAVLPAFRAQNGGVIVNVSSVTGRFGIPFLSAYCAGKFALEGLSESLYYELAPLNIRIKLVEPGGIRTNFVQEFAQHDAYQPGLGAVERSMREATAPESSLPGPARVATTIFRAATDATARLRYPVHTQGAHILQKILPEWLWRSTLAKSFGVARQAAS